MNSKNSTLFTLLIFILTACQMPTPLTADEGTFKGTRDRFQGGDHLISVKAVLPYPVKSFNEIKDAQYQVTLVVDDKGDAQTIKRAEILARWFSYASRSTAGNQQSFRSEVCVPSR